MRTSSLNCGRSYQAEAIQIGSGVFTESIARWLDRDHHRSPFSLLDTSLPNEELEATIAMLFSMQKPRSFELLRKSFAWNSLCVEPLINDRNMSLHEMRVALTGTKKKTEKCLAKPKLLKRIPTERKRKASKQRCRTIVHRRLRQRGKSLQASNDEHHGNPRRRN